MTDTHTLFKEKKFPDWFVGHKIFQQIKSIKKVFPGIGLPNFTQPVVFDNLEKAKESALSFVRQISFSLSDLDYNLKNTSNPKTEDTKEILSLLSDLSDMCSSHTSRFVVGESSKKVSIKLPKNILYNNKVIFKSGQSLFSVINKINEKLLETNLGPLISVDEMTSFKNFSSDNIPSKRLNIVFSSDGTEGLWDIATMSMRGISSCQNWTNGEYKYSTIGSTIDPFVGIIYLTSGDNWEKYGSKMARRCIVRFAVDALANKPIIVLEKMYPSLDENVLNSFKKAIANKISSKIKVVYAPFYTGINSSYIPYSPIRDIISRFCREGRFCNFPVHRDDMIASYKDTNIKDVLVKENNQHSDLFLQNVKIKEKSFSDNFESYFIDSIMLVNIDDFFPVTQVIVRQLRGQRQAGGFSYFHLLNKLSDIFVKNSLAFTNKDNFYNSNFYLKKIFVNFFNYQKNIIELSKNQFIKVINSEMKLKGSHIFSPKQYDLLIGKIFLLINDKMKKDFRDHITTLNLKKNNKPLSLP